ncbi:MAG: hypothetical protein NC319_06295 [Butyricicoccus sp.]|nr:hypothetical protein [Butyricicoccus sp.]MCM1236544.1 hypothetical protein [Ruminococcus flavefaciens]
MNMPAAIQLVFCDNLVLSRRLSKRERADWLNGEEPDEEAIFEAKKIPAEYELANIFIDIENGGAITTTVIEKEIQ